jgi:hypothetical protein
VRLLGQLPLVVDLYYAKLCLLRQVLGLRALVPTLFLYRVLAAVVVEVGDPLVVMQYMAEVLEAGIFKS